MKKTIFSFAIAIAMAQFVTSCQQDDPMADLSITINKPAPTEQQTITFSCVGDFDFSTQPMRTRSMTADGKAMTDLWVLDYIDGSLAQSAIHQVSTDDDFGTPTLSLTTGDHHLYFIASRGKNPALDTDAHTITFGAVSDTFYKDLLLDVTASSNGSRSVTLERCVTKFTAVITDAIPEGAATFNITPAQWYYGWNYVAGTPTTSTASQTITINIPSSEIGVTNERLNIFCFSAATEWTTDVAIDCKKGDGTILGTATIADAPLKQNRITTFSGPLFSANGLTTVSLSSEWLDDYIGIW